MEPRRGDRYGARSVLSALRALNPMFWDPGASAKRAAPGYLMPRLRRSARVTPWRSARRSLQCAAGASFVAMRRRRVVRSERRRRGQRVARGKREARCPWNNRKKMEPRRGDRYGARSVLSALRALNPNVLGSRGEREARCPWLPYAAPPALGARYTLALGARYTLALGARYTFGARRA
jgi:hypothetical protein